MINRKKFGSRLRSLRKENRLTMEQFGNIIGVDKATISQYESGKKLPRPDGLLLIADFFDVSIDYLLDRTDRREFYSDSVIVEGNK